MSNYIQVKPTGSTELWNRPTDWLSIPTIGATEEVLYLLNAVWNTTSNPIALLIGGTGAGYTVDWGDGTTTNYAFNVKAERNYTYSSLSGTPFRGYRQVLIKITPQAGSVINSVNLCQRHTSYAYAYHTGLLEIICNIETQYLESPFTRSLLVTHSNVENVFYKKNTNTSLFYLFYGFSSLQKVNAFPTLHCSNIECMFGGCSSIKEVPKFDFSNITHANSAFNGCNSLQKVNSNDFKKVVSAQQMFQACFTEDLSNIQFRDVTNLYLFNYLGGNLKRLPDLSLCNSIVGSLDYSFYTSPIYIYPYINLAGVTSMSVFFNLVPTRILRRSLLVGATRSHSYANQLLDAANINFIFSNLGTANVGAIITVSGNPGSSTCTPSIATAKGWIVVT